MTFSSQTELVAQVRGSLSKHQVPTKPEWVESVVARLLRRSEVAVKVRHNPGWLESMVFSLVLHSDLRDCCLHSLPSNVSRYHSGCLPGSYIVQVMKLVNICEPEFEGKNVAVMQSGPKRTLRLTLCDAAQSVSAVELKPIHQLTDAAGFGCKLLISKVTVRRGVLLLTPSNVKFLGGGITVDLPESPDSIPQSPVRTAISSNRPNSSESNLPIRPDISSDTSSPSSHRSSGSVSSLKRGRNAAISSDIVTGASGPRISAEQQRQSSPVRSAMPAIESADQSGLSTADSSSSLSSALSHVSVSPVLSKRKTQVLDMCEDTPDSSKRAGGQTPVRRSFRNDMRPVPSQRQSLAKPMGFRPLRPLFPPVSNDLSLDSSSGALSQAFVPCASQSSEDDRKGNRFWSCPECTFDNDFDRPQCEICDCLRPSSS